MALPEIDKIHGQPGQVAGIAKKIDDLKPTPKANPLPLIHGKPGQVNTDNTDRETPTEAQRRASHLGSCRSKAGLRLCSQISGTWSVLAVWGDHVVRRGIKAF
jgi:hypothetical protein